MDWDAFIDAVKDDAGVLAKPALKQAIQGAATDLDAFVQAQGAKVKDCLRQLADGRITREQFHDYIEDIRDLAQEQLDARAIAAAAGARSLVNDVCRVLLDKLIALI